MNTTFKLAIALLTGMYSLTACNSATSTGNTDTTSTVAQDTMKMNNAGQDTMAKEMNMNDSGKMNNDLMTAMNNPMMKMEGMKMTGDFDLDFANMLMEHHQGAVDMSKVEIAKGTDEKMKAMAQNIITKQTEEIGKLQQLVNTYKPMKMDMGKHDELSKGLEDMKAKMSDMKMSGNTDKDFATMMASHHEDGVKMSKEELTHGMNAQLKQMAQKGITDQTKEIAEFKSWLAQNK